MGKYNLFVLIILGIILGITSFVSPATFLMSIIIFIIGIALWNLKLPEEEKRFLIRIFIAAILVRVLICLLIYFVSLTQGGEGSLFQDDVGQPRIAWLVYQSRLGKFDLQAYQNVLCVERQVGTFIKEGEHYLLLISLLYSVIGYYTPLVAKFINIILGSLLVVMIYDMAKEVVDKKIAKISAISVAFFPSLILWSIVALKDIPCIFLVIVAIWLYMKWIQTKKWHFLCLLPFAIISLFSIRKQLAMLVLAALLISFFVYLKISWSKKIAFICLMCFCFCFMLPYKFKAPLLNRFSVNSLLSLQRGYVTTGGNVYKILDEHFYKGDEKLDLNFSQVSKAASKGIIYLMLVPFPWHGKNLWQILSIPQMVFWYFLLPFFILGVIFVLRYKFRTAFPIMILLAMLIISMALCEGNVGTAVRHREAITPFFLVFALTGLRQAYLFLGKKQ